MEATQHANGLIAFVPLIMVMLMGSPFLIAWVRVFSRVGSPAWLGVLMFIPLVNFVRFLIFGFREWPIEKRLRSRSPDACG
jgi:hypothetical protein